MKKAIIKILDDIKNWEEKYEEGEPYGFEGIQDFLYSGSKTTSGDLTLEVVEQYGGEGKGDQWWAVIKATQGDVVKHWKIPGWYQSYHGAEINYEDLFEVKAKTVEVIRWVQV